MSVKRSIRSDANMKDNTAADTRIRMTRRTLLAGAPFVAAAAGLRPERAEANAMFVKTSGATIRVLRKVDGPPLLLLHGHPETHVTWHRIATDLSSE